MTRKNRRNGKNVPTADSYAVGLQSVENYLSVRMHERLRRNWSACIRMKGSFLEDISRAVARFSRGPVARNHRQHFSIQLDPIRLQSSIVSKKTESTVSTFSIQLGRIRFAFPDRIEKILFFNTIPRRLLQSYLTQLDRQSAESTTVIACNWPPWRSG